MHDWRQAFLKNAALLNMRAPIGVGMPFGFDGSRPCPLFVRESSASICWMPAIYFSWPIKANWVILPFISDYFSGYRQRQFGWILFMRPRYSLGEKAKHRDRSLPENFMPPILFHPVANGCGWLAGLKTAEK